MPETDLVWFFVLKSILGIVRRCSREAFAILSLKLRSPHVRIYLTCAIDYGKRGVCCLTEVKLLHFQSQVLAAHFLVQRLRIHYSCGK